MFGSSVPPDLLDTITSVVGERDLLLERRDLLRVGAVQHVQGGEAAALAERLGQHLRARGWTRPCRAAARR